MNYENSIGYLQDRVMSLELRVKELEDELESIKNSRLPKKVEPGKLVLDPFVGEDWDDPDEKTDISDQLSGRIVYSLLEIEDGEISFNCGPETKDGWIDDSYDCGLYPQLEELLGHFDVSVGAAENYHTISVPDGVDPNKIWKQVEEILINAGAVEWERPDEK